LAATTARVRRIIGTEFGTKSSVVGTDFPVINTESSVVGANFSAARARHASSHATSAAGPIDLRLRPGTLLRRAGVGRNRDKNRLQAAGAPLSAGAATQSAAKPGRHHPRIGQRFGQKIIGRSLPRLCWQRVPTACAFFAWRYLSRPLHQAACQHGVGAFLQVNVQQLRDLFAHIRGVAQSRKFVALQGAARSREQKIPRWLGGIVAVQGALQRADFTNTSILVNGTNWYVSVEKLWKSLP
jgi:hypothetical protein